MQEYQREKDTTFPHPPKRNKRNEHRDQEKDTQHIFKDRKQKNITWRKTQHAPKKEKKKKKESESGERTPLNLHPKSEEEKKKKKRIISA